MVRVHSRCPLVAAGALTVVGAAAAAYHWCLRPRHLHWGATDAEVAATLPGDELSGPTPFVDTRAVTIDAPPDEVWAWLSQIGWGRGGFYSYNVLENLFGADLHNADRVHPEWQSLEVGDKVWMAPEGRFGAASALVVAEVAPGRHVVFGPRPGEQSAWTFVLFPLDDGRATRLVVRWQQVARTPVESAFWYVFELPHFLMERGMLLGLKARAERTAGGA